MEKYYTPDVSEFYLGFEYESLDNIYDHGSAFIGDMKDWTWRKRVFGYNANDQEDIEFDFNYQINNSEYVRVKCLDREDIESLGFVYERTGGISSDVFKIVDNDPLNYPDDIEYKYLYYNYIDHNLCVHNDKDWDASYTWFDGIIKNKSELKKLLKQLGIE